MTNVIGALLEQDKKDTLHQTKPTQVIDNSHNYNEIFLIQIDRQIFVITSIMNI